MANKLYPKYKGFCLDMTLGAGGSPATPVVKALLVDLDDYTYSDDHEFLSSVPAEARVAVSAALDSKTFANGIFKAAATVFAAASGDESEAVIIFIDTGIADTSRLVAYLDTGFTGLPVTPNGADLNLNWDAAGIFTL